MSVIKIKRNEAGNCITFEGSSNPVYWNSCLSGEIDATDNTLINVVNDIITAQSGTTQYEFFRIPYTNFVDADGNPFSTAQDCRDYITQEANVLGSIGEQIATSSDTFNFYLDSKDNTVIMSTGDYFPVNTIQATLHSDNTLRIVSIIGVKTYYSNINLANVSIDSVLLTGTESQKVNELNTLFQHAGSSMGQAPTITSALTVNLTTGDTLNYELTADYGVGYEWDLSSVSGVVNVEGNVRKIIGGSSLTAGTYNIPVKAVNYFGEDSETISLVVSNPPYSSTKSVKFNVYDDLDTSASDRTVLNSVLGRSSNGSGSSDAWTIAFWFKGGTSTDATQTILQYGGSNQYSDGSIWITWTGATYQRLKFKYGTYYNYLQLRTPANSITSGTWHHVVITYNGGTTGAGSGSINDYYGRFNIYIDGALQTTDNSNANYGYTNNIDDSYFKIGEASYGDYLRNNCLVDELAFWDSDQSSNASTIYNSGTPHDLNALTASPSHWWKMGDGDTYPVITDNSGSVDLDMNSMTAASFVSDAP
jgi:hypothetical protein